MERLGCIRLATLVDSKPMGGRRWMLVNPLVLDSTTRRHHLHRRGLEGKMTDRNSECLVISCPAHGYNVEIPAWTLSLDEIPVCCDRVQLFSCYIGTLALSVVWVQPLAPEFNGEPILPDQEKE
jgi:hypothetical protein